MSFSIHIFALLLAAALDIFANIMIARSNGFKNKKLGFGGITLVMLSFALLAFATTEMELGVAYAVWGAFGIIGTLILGRVVLHQKFRAPALLGVILLVTGVIILNLY